MGTIMDADDVGRTIARIAHQIIEKTALDAPGAGQVVLLGIPSGGVPLAARLAVFVGHVIPNERTDRRRERIRQPL